MVKLSVIKYIMNIGVDLINRCGNGGYMNSQTNNPNHPPKGAVLRIEPIRCLEAIEAIKKHLESQPRNAAIFTLGINSNLRASDLLKITVGGGEGFTPRRPVDAPGEKDRENTGNYN